MQASRFDTLTRTLTTAGSRRGALGVLLGGTLGLLGLARRDGAAAGKSRPCTPACGECQRCQPGKRKQKKPGKKHGKTARQTGTCQPLTGTGCGTGGTCQNGACVAPPPPGRCPGGLECGDACCTAPPGFTPARIACVSAGGGPPSCACTYLASALCTNCDDRPFTFDCEPLDPDVVRARCAEAGCPD